MILLDSGFWVSFFLFVWNKFFVDDVLLFVFVIYVFDSFILYLLVG